MNFSIQLVLLLLKITRKKADVQNAAEGVSSAEIN
jgi:hypothetical protein